jgi:site-specific recombinase XerD
MKNLSALMRYVQQFFRDYLGVQRGLSRNTVLAYRDTLKLFLSFTAASKGTTTMKIGLDDLTADAVLAFLKDIESSRLNNATTRNLRLASLRTFFTYLGAQDPLHAGQYQSILAIPAKRAPKPYVGYLEVHELKAVLQAIDRNTRSGERDYVLLNLLYNTGARVQEICDLRVKSIRFDPPAVATIRGKGGKTRVVPLWAETAEILHRFLIAKGLADDPDAILFPNSRGECLGRFGVRHIIAKRVAKAANVCPSLAKKRISPHTFRHTTAMHLLQAGVDLSVIKSWLGHVNLSTTHFYVEIDLEMKRKALSTCSPMVNTRELKQLMGENEDLISWLENLS